MYHIIAYIKHTITATNQYGVHSPFVYRLLTTCLYRKPTYKGAKSENVLLKSINYFKLKNIKFHEPNEHIEKRIMKEFKVEKSEKHSYDLIYFKTPNTINTTDLKDKVHNGSLVFIHDIHKDKSTTQSWNSLVEDLQFNVSIDFFYCGVLFFRKEQVKEHFKIRI